MSQFSLTLRNSIKRGNAELRNVTDRMASTWRRSTRAVGGYWIGTAEYNGTRDDLLEIFLEGMMREIREDTGGFVTWQGFIAEQRLTLDGVTYVRSMVDLVNACKILYTRIGDTLLNNGGAELAAWGVATGKGGITGSATVTQSIAWVNTGTYSCKVVANGIRQGANIQGGAGAIYPITIVANTAYEITGVIKVDSGSWRVSVNRSDTDASLCFDSSRGATGERTIKMNIPATNTYAGLVDLRITSEQGGTTTVYGDTFYFGLAPFQAQTGWATDLNSMTEYGRMELASLEVAMSSAAANAKAATVVKKQAWPKSLPPDEFTLVGNDLLGDTKDKLELTVHGYVHTLANKYSLTTGTGAASAQVTSIINEAEFVEPGSISSNTLSNLIDTRGPIKHWQVLMDITNAGDASGNRWVCGVHNDRLFDYGLADNQIAYHYRGGKFYHAAGGELEPWFAEPGHLLYLDDAPIGPGQISGVLEDDPHIVFVSEVEMGPPTDAYPNGTLTMRHESQVI